MHLDLLLKPGVHHHREVTTIRPTRPGAPRFQIAIDEIAQHDGLGLHEEHHECLVIQFEFVPEPFQLVNERRAAELDVGWQRLMPSWLGVF